MSAVIEKFIICDYCGDNFGVDFRNRTIAEQRKQAKNNGWSVQYRFDYCEQCTKEDK